MNFKSLALAALLASTTLAGPANAGPVAAAAAAVASFLSSGTALAFVARVALTVGLTALQSALAAQQNAPKVRAAGVRTDVTQTGGTNGQRIILGRMASAGALVAAPYSFPNSGDEPNKILTYVVSVSDMPGVTLNRLIVNGAYVTDIGTVSPTGSMTPHEHAGLFNDDGNHFLAWTWHDGTQTTADAFMMARHTNPTDTARPWSADMIGRGVSYAVVSFKGNRQVYSGLPAVMFEVDGIPLYDPRLDTTVGGSGAHRWNDTATWEQTDNPAVMIYNILRGITVQDGFVYGGAAEAEDLPLSTWFAAMNACDEAVPLKAGGTQPRYRAGIEIDVAEDEPAGVIEQLLMACSAEIAEVGGVFFIRVGEPDLPVLSFADDDIIADDPETLTPYDGLDQTYNAISATHPSPAALWEGSEAVVKTNATWESEDGDRLLMAEVVLNAVPYNQQVQRLATAWIRDARRMRQHRLALPPEAAVLSPLDSVEWTSVRNGYTTKVFEVTSKSEDLVTCLQSINIRERDDSDFNWTPETDEDDVVVIDPSVTEAVARTVTGWSLTAVSILDSSGTVRRPGLKMSWADDIDDADALAFEVRPVGQTDLSAQGSTPDLATGYVILSEGVVPGVDYEARGRLRIPGRATVWTDWESATAGDVRFTADDLEDAINESIADAAAAAAAAQAAADDTAALLNTEAANLRREMSELQLMINDPFLDDTSATGWTEWGSGTGTITYATNTKHTHGQDVRIACTTTQADGLTAYSNLATGIWLGEKNPEAVAVSIEWTRNISWADGCGFTYAWINDAGTWFEAKADLTSTRTTTAQANGDTVTSRAVLKRPDGFTGTFDRARFGIWVNDYTEFDDPGDKHDSDITIHRVLIRPATQEEIGQGQVLAEVLTQIDTWATSYGLNGASINDTLITYAGADKTFAGHLTDLSSDFDDNSARIDRIEDVQTTGGTAFANLMTQLAVDAGGTSATVTNHSAAIATLEGYTTASYSLRLQAGSSGALFEIVATEDLNDPGASGSVARFVANEILLSGSVTADSLAITETGGNLVHNGDFLYQDFRGWISEPTKATNMTEQDDAGSTVEQLMPTPAAFRARVADIGTTFWINTFAVDGDDKFTVSWRQANETGGGATARFKVVLRYELPDGTFHSNSGTDAQGSVFSSNQWNTTVGTGYEVFEVDGPTNTAGDTATVCKVGIERVSTGAGDTADAYISKIRIVRKSAAGVLIKDGTIQSGHIDTVSMNVAGLAVFDGELFSDGYSSGSSGWRIGDDGNAEFNDLSIRGVLTVGGKFVTDHLGLNSVTNVEFTESGSTPIDGDTTVISRSITWTAEQKLIFFIRVDLYGVIISPSGYVLAKLQILNGGTWVDITSLRLDAPSERGFTMADVPSGYVGTNRSFRVRIKDEGSAINVSADLLSMVIKR